MNQFLQNKYSKWYFNIIESRKNNPANQNVERHHIIPCSMGGANTPENKVVLTAREHFIVHLLLVKMTTGRAHYQMKAAVARNIGKDKVSPTSKIYAMVRQHRKDAASYFGKGRKLTQEDKDNKRLAALNMDPKLRLKVSDSTRIKSAETKEKMRAFALQRPKRACTKCGKICAVNILGRYHDDKCRW